MCVSLYFSTVIQLGEGGGEIFPKGSCTVPFGKIPPPSRSPHALPAEPHLSGNPSKLTDHFIVFKLTFGLERFVVIQFVRNSTEYLKWLGSDVSIETEVN